MNRLTYYLCMMFVLLAGPVFSKAIKTSSYGKTIRLACVGDSITEGSGLKKGKTDYPTQLQKMLGKKWDVKNFGIRMRTLLSKGDAPYVKSDQYKESVAFKPDVVVIMLGTNDAKGSNWRKKVDFVSNYIDLIKVYRDLNPKVKVYICNPPPVFPEKFGITDKCIREEVLPLVKTVGKKAKVPVIDIYKALEGKGSMFPDKIHPGVDGAGVIAKTVKTALTGK